MKIRRISPQEAKQQLDAGYTYIDVRSVPEFVEGHPEGAVNVPLLHMTANGMEANPRFLEVMQSNFSNDAQLVIGCKAGGRSLRAAEMMQTAGYENLFEQRAGWDGSRDAFGQILEPGWSRLELPIGSGEPEGRSYASLEKKTA